MTWQLLHLSRVHSHQAQSTLRGSLKQIKAHQRLSGDDMMWSKYTCTTAQPNAWWTGALLPVLGEEKCPDNVKMVVRQTQRFTRQCLLVQLSKAWSMCSWNSQWSTAKNTLHFLCFSGYFKHTSCAWIPGAFLRCFSIHYAPDAGSMLHPNQHQSETCLAGQRCFH